MQRRNGEEAHLLLSRGGNVLVCRLSCNQDGVAAYLRRFPSDGVGEQPVYLLLAWDVSEAVDTCGVRLQVFYLLRAPLILLFAEACIQKIGVEGHSGHILHFHGNTHTLPRIITLGCSQNNLRLGDVVYAHAEDIDALVFGIEAQGFLSHLHFGRVGAPRHKRGGRGTAL